MIQGAVMPSARNATRKDIMTPAAWNANKQTLPPRRSTMRADHVGPGPCLIDENWATGINAALVTLPSRVLSRRVGSFLLGGV